MTSCNISVITEDIYFKLGLCVHYPKEQSILLSETIQTTFQNYAPLFDWDILSSINPFPHNDTF